MIPDDFPQRSGDGHSPGHEGRTLRNGALADVAPTILELAGLPGWPGITGRSLLAG